MPPAQQIGKNIAHTLNVLRSDLKLKHGSQETNFTQTTESKMNFWTCLNSTP
jgi:hypothetical protein